jgi:hypothetical protein
MDPPLVPVFDGQKIALPFGQSTVEDVEARVTLKGFVPVGRPTATKI